MSAEQPFRAWITAWGRRATTPGQRWTISLLGVFSAAVLAWGAPSSSELAGLAAPGHARPVASAGTAHGETPPSEPGRPTQAAPGTVGAPASPAAPNPGVDVAVGPGPASDEPARYERVTTVRSDGVPPGDIWITRASWVDDARSRYYLSEPLSDAVHIVDTTAKQVVATVHGFSGPPSGLVTDSRGRLWVATATGSLDIVDPEAGRVVGSVALGSAPTDRVAYSPQDVVLVTRPLDVVPSVVVVDAVDAVVTRHVPLPLATIVVGQPVWHDSSGHFLVPIGVAVGTDGAPRGRLLWVDPRSGSVAESLSLGACVPAGMALGSDSQAIVGCSEDVVVVDLARRETRWLRDLGAVHDAWYNQPAGEFYVATTAHGSSQVIVLDGTTFEVRAEIATKANSTSVAATTGEIYVPIAGEGIAVFRA